MARVLFVCLGNICRSPLAEAAFRAAALARGIAVDADSAGTAGWHAGRAPDPRSISEAARHGIDITGYRARQVAAPDFSSFAHICAMDADNLADLRAMAPPDTTAHLSLLLDHAPGRAGQSVPDPYYGEAGDFAAVWRMVCAGAEGLLEQLCPAPSGGQGPVPPGGGSCG